MSGVSMLTSGVAGIQKGMADAQRSAEKLASSAQLAGDTPTEDMAASLVELNQAEIQVKASAKVVEAYNNTAGALLDEFA